MGMEGALTHLNPAGRAEMVDVGGKTPTDPRAGARAVVRMTPAAAARVAAGDNPKGDVVAVARIAAIQAAKRTDELIPLCHQLPLTHVDPQVTIDPAEGTVTLVVETATTERTGVEMEAMVACSIGALTVYDMVKGIEPGVTIERVELLEKTGGKSGFRREGSEWGRARRSWTATDVRSATSASRSPTAATSAASTACRPRACRGWRA